MKWLLASEGKTLGLTARDRRGCQCYGGGGWRKGDGDGELSVIRLGTDHDWAVSRLRERNSLPHGGQERVHSLSLCEETGRA